jgi:hypothetical protein
MQNKLDLENGAGDENSPALIYIITKHKHTFYGRISKSILSFRCRTLEEYDELYHLDTRGMTINKVVIEEIEYMKNYNFQYKDGGRVDDGVGLLISILLRYPEVCSVRYMRKQHALKFQFLLFASTNLAFLPQTLLDALEAFHQLQESSMKICKVEGQQEEDYYHLTVTRDVESMNQNEVGLIVELVKGTSMNELLYEEVELQEDELHFQEEVIAQVLEHLQKNELDKNVIALRDDGRVLVYNN